MKRLIKFLPSFIKVLLLKRKGTIGKNCKLQFGSYIYADTICIGNNFSLAYFSTIRTKHLTISHDVVIDRNTHITALKRIELKEEVLISNDIIIGGMQTHESELEIGKKVHIYPYSFLNTTRKLTLEDEVGIGGSCYLFTHGSWQNAYDGFPISFGPITIKKGAWLPWRVFVMPGITIGEYATIGSDALITKDIPARSFAVGVPAKVIKSEGEYIKEMTPVAKNDLMREILTAFMNDQRFKNNASLNFKEDEEQMKLVYDNGYEIVYSLKNIKNPEKGLLLTELPSNSAAIKNTFDLKNKTCLYPLEEIQEIFNNHLTSFGIRLYKIGKNE